MDGTVTVAPPHRGAYLLAVSAPGYGACFQEVVLAESGKTVVQVRLKPLPGRLRGSVTSARSGAPVTGALVELGSRRTQTDANGEYSLDGLTAGVHTLRVTSADHEPHETTVTIRRGSSERLDVSLVLANPVLQVRVVDDVTGEPIEGAAVTYDAGDALPCADAKLLVPLKRSRLYGSIRPRISELRPIDSWLQDGLHFFAFRLKPPSWALLGDLPVAVFAMHPDSAEPLSGVVLTPSPNGGPPELTDLLQAARTDLRNGHISPPTPSSGQMPG
jgi:Carboxypeptidase regulatory-like domain